MARGGARPNSGRKPGSGNRPNILDYWNGTIFADKVMDFFAHITKSYKKSAKLAIWVGDQVSGKAPQNIKLAGDPDSPLTLTFDKAFDK